MVETLYERIGRGYAELRRPEPRIAARLEAALGSARSVVNVGAGAGSYEPPERALVAVEPACAMIAQRTSDAPVVRAEAGRLPFPDEAFDASLAILTAHHWPDRLAGLREMARVSRGVNVCLTWDPDAPAWWLVEDYFPSILTVDRAIFPTLEEFSAAWGDLSVEPVHVPLDCRDGFLAAYWRRPAAYLSDAVRAAMSSFARPELDGELDAGLRALRRDLEDGTWVRRNAALESASEWDTGYRLVISSRA